jgi:hypothetical protein
MSPEPFQLKTDMAPYTAPAVGSTHTHTGTHTHTLVCECAYERTRELSLRGTGTSVRHPVAAAPCAVESARTKPHAWPKANRPTKQQRQNSVGRYDVAPAHAEGMRKYVVPTGCIECGKPVGGGFYPMADGKLHPE